MIWREPPRGGYPDMRLFALSGLEQMRSYMRGYGVPPPIARLTGMRPSAVEPGDVTFTMPATGWLLSPAGVIGGGVLAILADAPLGSAVQTALPPFTPYTTAELSMTFLRPATPESGLLACRGTLIHAGRSIGLSACTIHDERGRLLAHGTSRCHVFPPVAPPPDDPPDIGEPAGPDPDPDPPDPHLRQVEGETLPRAVWEELDGLAIMRGLIAGDLPAPPLHHLIGCRPVEASEGSATFVLPATEWLNSPLARVEGGVTAMLGDLAMAAAVQTTVPPATAFATLDLKVNFLRPLASDGREIRAVGTVVHRGKTVAVAGAEVLDPDGKRAALATGSSMLLPGRPMDLRRPVVPEEDGGG